MRDSSDSSDGEREFKFRYYLSDDKEEEDSENSEEEENPTPDLDSSPKEVRNRIEIPPYDDDSEMYDLSEEEQVEKQDEEQKVQGEQEEQKVQGEQKVEGEGEEEGGEEDFEYSDEEKTPIPSFWFSTEVRNWLELPPELISLIFTKVGVIDILLGAQFVCSAWQKLSKQPHFYRSIDLRNHDDRYYLYDERYNPERLVKLAVHRSAGQLVEFSVKHVGTDAMLRSITEM